MMSLIILSLLAATIAVDRSNQLVQFVDELDSSSANKINNDDYFFPTHQYSKIELSYENSTYPDQTRETLGNKLIDEVCRLDRGAPRLNRLFNNTYLMHCYRYKLNSLLSNEALASLMHNSTNKCRDILDELIQLDDRVNYYGTIFENLLKRYNCHNGYSIKWSCEDCMTAYRDWLCVNSLPYFMHGERVKPCFSFCERVEQRCPYLNPIAKEQYGGQPVFICRDPNIPFVPEITPDIPYEVPPRCYELCHLSEDVDELKSDSLSRYRFDQCPKRSFIAEKIHDFAA